MPTILVWGPQFVVAAHSERHVDLLGPWGAILGRRLLADFPELTARLAPRLHQAINGETLVAEDVAAQITRDGQVQSAWFDAVYTPVRDEAGVVAGVLICAVETTAEIRAERDRREAEAQFRSLADQLEVGIGMIDLQGAVTFANARLAQILDRSENALAGLDVMTLAAEEDREQNWMLMQRLLRRGEPFTIDKRVLRPDGSKVWVRSAVSPRRDADGHIVGALAAVIDLSGSKAAEEQLRGSEARFQTLANLAPDLLWSHTAQGIDWINRRWLDYTGQTEAEALGDGWLNAIHPEDREASARAGRRAEKTGEPIEHEHRIRRHDGQFRWFLVRAEPLRDERTGALRWFGAATDIHDHRAALEDLAASAESLRLALDIGGLAAWDWNMEADQVTWSDEHFRMLGYDLYGVEPSYEAWVQRLHGDDRADTEAALNSAMAGHHDFVREFRTEHPDGVVRWLSTRARFFYDESGTPLRMVGVMRDVTDQRGSDQTQKILLAELQRRTRNQLAVIRSIAARTAESAASVDDFLMHFGGRLDAYARADAALTRNPDVSLDLESLIRDEFLAAAGADDAQISGPSVKLSGQVAETVALVFHELVTNALKFGALAAAAGRVQVSWSLEPRDSGPVLVLDWRESGVPVLDPMPAHRGFGRRLIEEALPYELNARSELRFVPGGAHARFEFPLDAQLPRAPETDA
ncbi:PAS domain-containing protein [Phenylobacterium deserti]|uniref:histidine kinase n=1 Tax=Phenylobacterium deserti TaxID=1914756 RepID=A0A328AN98_9CAUL|nr:PAS domain-containing protein [Phenylobacterium deserti]RAK56473.1 hypothetical protein DJ018_00355 [Phenylobacterium deserti]